jgi:hypothetical protein
MWELQQREAETARHLADLQEQEGALQSQPSR